MQVAEPERYIGSVNTSFMACVIRTKNWNFMSEPETRYGNLDSKETQIVSRSQNDYSRGRIHQCCRQRLDQDNPNQEPQS
jgi:hypothetical protein